MQAECDRFTTNVLHALFSCLVVLLLILPFICQGEEQVPAASPAPPPRTEEEAATAAPDITFHLSAHEPEAPEAFFAFQLGDKDVEFFLAGEWQAALRGSLGFMSRPATGLTSLDAFPGITSGFYFEQTPELTFSVWLMQQYFAELALLKDFKDSSFLIGYEGKEDELVQHLYLGSQEINLDPYPFMVFPEQGESSLGIEAEIKAGRSRQQWLGRFDNNSQGEKIFIGQNEVIEKIIPLYDYLPGRYFKLPDTDVAELSVYVEDAEADSPGDDGKKYRPVRYEEAVLDAGQGLVSFKQQPAGRVLVYYTKNGHAIGEPGQGLGAGALAVIDEDGLIDLSMAPVDFDWNTPVAYPGPVAQPMSTVRQVMLGSRACLLLWEPTVFSPFEIQAAYTLPEGSPAESWRTRISLVKSTTRQSVPGSPVHYTFLPEEDRFVAYLTENLRDDLSNLYPFLELDKRLYGPYAERTAGNYPYELLVQVFFPVASYYLEPHILPGSVQVKRNGQEETRFSIDYETGVLVFHTSIQALDRLEITYKKKGALVNNGELLLAWGNILDLNDNLLLETATGLQWNILPGAFSEQAFSHTGSLLSSARLTGEYEHVNFQLSVGASFSQPDTTGRLRLLGMEGTGIDVALDESLAYPASEPAAGTSLPAIGSRGKLFYKDYREYQLLGGYLLQPPDWTLPAEQIFAYTDGSQPGPYQVAGSSAGSGESLALDFELSASNDWAGCQLPVIPGAGDPDLSSLKGLTLSYRVIDFTGNFDVYLQLGELNEDVDGDLQLDKEGSAAATGFLFDDADNTVTLRVGGGPRLTGNLRLDTEDINGNGALDPEKVENIWTTRLAQVTGNTGWQVVNYTFDKDTRKKLIRCRAVRLLVVNTSGSACTGRLLIDRLNLAGTSWGAITENTTGGSLTIKEIRESELENPPAVTLDKAYDEVSTVFHPGGQTQKVLELDWSGYASTESWTARGFTQTGSEGAAYQEVNLYLRLPDLITAPGTPQLTFALLDAEGRGIVWTIPATAFSEWRKLTVDTSALRVLLAGSMLPAASVQVDNGYGSLNQLQVTVTDTTEGTLYLDELYLGTPEASWGGAVDLHTELSFPGPLLSVGQGQIPVLADLFFTGRLQLASPGFTPFYGRPYQSWLTSSLTELAVDILHCTLEVNLAVRGTDTAFSWEGGHRLTLPEEQLVFPVRFSDEYNLKQAVYGLDFSRSNTLVLSLPDIVFSSFKSTAAALDSFLKQTWEGKLTLAQPQLYRLDYPLLEAMLSLSLSQEEYHSLSSDYFTNWFRDYRLLLPWTEGKLKERTGSLVLKLQSPPAVVQAHVYGETGFQSAGFKTDSRWQTNRLVYELSFPLSLSGDESFSLTPGYRRSWSAACEETGWSDFYADTGQLFSRLSTQLYAVNQIPFYELFAPTTETEFLQQASLLSAAHYEPKFWLSLSRKLSSRVSDLFLPVKLDFSLAKALHKENLLSQFLTNYHFTYKAQTINLFGEYGKYPLFAFYKIDEIMNSFSFQLTYDNTQGLTHSEYIVTSYWGFEGERKNLFTINNEWRLTQGKTEKMTDELTLGFNWFLYPRPGTTLPFKQAFTLFKQDKNLEDHIAHEEAVTLRFTKEWEAGSFHPFHLLLSHKTTFQYPGHGFWGVEVSLGMDKERILYDQLHEDVYRFIISLGINGQMQF